MIYSHFVSGLRGAESPALLSCERVATETRFEQWIRAWICFWSVLIQEQRRFSSHHCRASVSSVVRSAAMWWTTALRQLTMFTPKMSVFFLLSVWLGSLSYGLSFFFWPLITIICRRKSVRVVAMLGGLIASMGFLFMSFSFNLEQIAASMVVLALGKCQNRINWRTSG